MVLDLVNKLDELKELQLSLATEIISLEREGKSENTSNECVSSEDSNLMLGSSSSSGESLAEYENKASSEVLSDMKSVTSLSSFELMSWSNMSFGYTQVRVILKQHLIDPLSLHLSF